MHWIRKKMESIRQSGIRLYRLNRVLIAAAVVISVLMLYLLYQTEIGFGQMRSATERYIACQQDAVLFEEGSDYLTNECRYFVVNGDKQHVFNFIEEVEVTRRRERTRDDAEYFMLEADSLKFLNEALRYSDELIETECYAMRLMIDALGEDVTQFPPRIQRIALEEKDAALTPEEKRTRAVQMLFDSHYEEIKGKIYENVEKSITVLMEETYGQQIQSTNRMERLLRQKRVLVVLLLILIASIVWFTSYLIIRPLKKNIQHLDSREPMAVAGSHEMRHLAVVYNDILSENNARHERLSYTATHDALTGLYNRAAYEKAYRNFRKDQIGVLVVDVDEFKKFNDHYGHDMGDRVLRRVAEVLKNTFRSEDHISRIGGDEFCVIMMNAGSALSGLVREKVDRMNRTLGESSGDMPPISLSVGIAFGDRENPTEDIFKDADTALYRVKQRGKTGCEIY